MVFSLTFVIVDCSASWIIRIEVKWQKKRRQETSIEIIFEDAYNGKTTKL